MSMRKIAFAATGLFLLSQSPAFATEPSDRQPYVEQWYNTHPLKGKRSKRVKVEQTHQRAVRYVRKGIERYTLTLEGYPQPLISKVQEIKESCGSTVISAFRPGSRVRGSGRLSLHALHKAVDMKDNPSCIYAHLKGWPGGYSTDYGSVQHVHISYAPGGHEWGLRFAHYSGHRNRARYAYRHAPKQFELSASHAGVH